MRLLNNSVIKRSVALMLVSVLALLCFSSCAKTKQVMSYGVNGLNDTAAEYSQTDNHITKAENLVFVGKSGLLEMYIDKISYSIAIKDTGTQSYWFALPEQEHSADGCRANVLEVTVFRGGDRYTLNSQDNAIAFGSKSYKVTEDGIQITYDMALDSDTALMSFDSLDHDALYISVTVSYVLKDGAFFAKINCSDIKLNGGYTIESISLLNYFGSSDSAQPGDYIFVPDANGAILSLTTDNGNDYDEMHFKVYGENPATKGEQETQFANALLGAFGVKKGDNAFLGLVLKGDAFAEISSYKKSEESDCNRVGASFKINDTLFAKKDGQQTCFKGAEYGGEISLCYRFLSGKNASYLGLATACREMLIRENVLSSEMLAASEHIPFMLTVRGAHTKRFAHSYAKLSTYEQTLDLLEMLKAKSVNSITLNYADMLTGANTQSLISGAKPISSLGSAKDFEALSQYIKTQKFSMFLDLNLVSTGGGRARASSLDGEYMSGQSTDPLAKHSKNNTVYYTSLPELDSRVVRFLNNMGSYSFDGYCVADAGKVLYSDYSSEAIGRTKAANTVSSELSVLSNNHKVMIDTGNFYSLKYADYVINLPRYTGYPTGEGYAQIPFVELVLHGLVNYSLEPINLNSDSKRAFMKSVEYGAMPSYEWICTTVEGDDEVNEKYYYDSSLAEAADCYLLADKALGDLADARLTNNYQVKEGVFVSEFDNSILIYFNYNDEAVTVNSIRLEPMSFVRVN